MVDVLLVADAAWVENDVAASLTDADTRIVTVSDPRTAVPAAVENGANVAIVDLQVGSMGGMAVVRALRAAVDSGELEPIRTVLLLDRSADLFLARRAGAHEAVVKPFTAQELRRAISLPTAATSPVD